MHLLPSDEERKVYSERHTQTSELYVKNSTVATCNLLFFQMHFALSFI